MAMKFELSASYQNPSEESRLLGRSLSQTLLKLMLQSDQTRNKQIYTQGGKQGTRQH